MLEIVIRAFQDGASAESIVDSYSTLTLSDTYGAIAYYLKNKDTVEEYLQQREELAESVKQRLQSVQPDLSKIRSRLEIYSDERVEEFRQENEVKLEKFKLS